MDIKSTRREINSESFFNRMASELITARNPRMAKITALALVQSFFPLNADTSAITNARLAIKMAMAIANS
jgi:hypothetical protein